MIQIAQLRNFIVYLEYNGLTFCIKIEAVNRQQTLTYKLIIKQAKALKLSTLTGFCFYTLLGCVI